MGSNAFYEFRNWHSDPDCRRLVVSCGIGVGVMLVCLACGCASELEATGGRSDLLGAATRSTPLVEEPGVAGIQVGLGPV